jgi:oxygen-dependent protoporphyrinogen oxidase
MPQFVAMEREQGSLISGLQARAQRRTQTPQPIFTSMRRGMDSLTKPLIGTLPQARIHFGSKICNLAEMDSDDTIIATPTDSTRSLLAQVYPEAATLLPMEASSAVLVAFAWPEQVARSFTIPAGFGFLVPDESLGKEQLLACTFVDQKFPHRAPEGARVMRAFFGGRSALSLESQSDEVIALCALEQLREILGPIPEPAFYTVRRLPRSLPQYEVGHLERIERLEAMVAQLPGLHLLGNSYHGVGIPDLIRDARAKARAIVEGP